MCISMLFKQGQSAVIWNGIHIEIRYNSECKQSTTSTFNGTNRSMSSFNTESTNLKHSQNANPPRDSCRTSPVLELAMCLRHQIIRNPSLQKAVKNKKQLFHFQTLGETRKCQKVCIVAFPKTTPSSVWPPTIQISASNVDGSSHTHSLHKMLYFELLSAVIPPITTEVQSPQHPTPQFTVLL